MTTPIRRSDYRPNPFAIDSVDLRFELGDEETLVHATLTVRRLDPASTEELLLDGEGLDTRAVSVDGKPREVVLADDGRLQLDGLGASATIATTVAIRPQDNTELSGLYRSSGMFCTQCEAEGFRRITWFQIARDILARYTTTIVADASTYPNLLSNGDRISSDTLEDGRLSVTWRDPWPKPCYLLPWLLATCTAMPGTLPPWVAVPFAAKSGSSIATLIVANTRRAA